MCRVQRRIWWQSIGGLRTIFGFCWAWLGGTRFGSPPSSFMSPIGKVSRSTTNKSPGEGMLTGDGGLTRVRRLFSSRAQWDMHVKCANSMPLS